MVTARTLAACLLASCSGGCVIERSQPGVMISTTPPGATLYVDGRDSGLVTPAALALPRNSVRRLDVELDGYLPVSRIVTPVGPVHLIPWTAGYLGPSGIWFPLYLSVPDLFAPIRMDDGFSPKRIHIALELDDNP
jgi:hypothetical protein